MTTEDSSGGEFFDDFQLPEYDMETSPGSPPSPKRSKKTVPSRGRKKRRSSKDHDDISNDTSSDEDLEKSSQISSSSSSSRGRGRGRGRGGSRGRGRGGSRGRGRGRKRSDDYDERADISDDADDDTDDDDPTASETTSDPHSNSPTLQTSTTSNEEHAFKLTQPDDKITLDGGEINEIVRNVNKRIGTGRYGVVYEVETTLGKVALKLWRKQTRFSKNDAGQLVTEALATQQCRSDNIVDLVGYHLVPPAACIITRYCQHGTLTRYYTEHMDTAYTHSKDFLCDLENAVSYVHSLGYLHRDIKTDNCFIDWSDTSGRLILRLGDFGHAADADYTGAPVSGTTGWDAPELNRGKRATQKSDIYSMGLVAFFLLNGKVPWSKSIFLKSDSDAGWARLVIECTKRLPEKRPGHDKIKEMLKTIPQLEKFPTSSTRLKLETIYSSNDDDDDDLNDKQ